MAVETAEDLASFFHDDEFAEAASYLAPGLGAVPVDCLVILDLGQGREVFAGGEQRFATSERHLWAQCGTAELMLAAVVRGGVFTIEASGEQLKVADLPKLDHTGHLWSVPLVMQV